MKPPVPVIDRSRRTVTVGDVVFRPHPQAFELFALLGRNPGHLCSADAIRAACHAEANVHEFTHNKIVQRARAELRQAGLRPDLIKGVWRFGYYWDDGN